MSISSTSSTPTASTTSTTSGSANTGTTSGTNASGNATSSIGNTILQSLGFANNLNVNSIVTALMGAEQAPLTLLQGQQSADQAKISALGTVSSALASLQTAAQALESGSITDTFTSMNTTASNPAVLSSIASTGASAGSYSITVNTLASTDIVRSNKTYSASDTFGNGSLAITVGGSTTNVAISSGSNTLSGIASAINASGAKVTASVINDGTTNRLLLTSATSGAAGAISVAVSGYDGSGSQSLNDFNYAGSNTASMVQSQPAIDSSFTLNGTTITRSSNTVSDVIPGVTLTLTQASTFSTPATTTLTVSPNASGQVTAIGAFISAYNTVIQTLGSVSAYDVTTNVAQPLNGDSVISALQASLPAIFSHSITGVGGGATTLADIGITLQSDGTMAINSNTLLSAITNPANDIAALFGSLNAGQQGFATQVDNLMKGYVGSGSAVGRESSSLTTQVGNLIKQQTAEQARLAELQTQFTNQFAAMDTTVSQMQSTQSFLTQQLQYANINAANKLG